MRPSKMQQFPENVPSNIRFSEDAWRIISEFTIIWSQCGCGRTRSEVILGQHESLRPVRQDAELDALRKLI